jgi:hypothetical protein
MTNSNTNISLVEAQELVPERFILHQLLKCYLGRDMSASEFEDLKQQPVELLSLLRLRTLIADADLRRKKHS